MAETFDKYVDALSEAAHEALADPTGRGRDWCLATVKTTDTPGVVVSGKRILAVGPAIKGKLSKSFVVSPDAQVTVRKSVVVGNRARVRSKGGNMVKGKDSVVEGPGAREKKRHPDRHHTKDVDKRKTLKLEKRVGKKKAKKLEKRVGKAKK